MAEIGMTAGDPHALQERWCELWRRVARSDPEQNLETALQQLASQSG